MSRALAVTWGLGVVLVAASPLLRNPLDDGFPLSTFPMFAIPLDQPTFYSAEGVGRDSRVMLSPELIANGAAMQSAQALQSAHAQGRADRRCANSASGSQNGCPMTRRWARCSA